MCSSNVAETRDPEILSSEKNNKMIHQSKKIQTTCSISSPHLQHDRDNVIISSILKDNVIFDDREFDGETDSDVLPDQNNACEIDDERVFTRKVNQMLRKIEQPIEALVKEVSVLKQIMQNSEKINENRFKALFEGLKKLNQNQQTDDDGVESDESMSDDISIEIELRFRNVEDVKTFNKKLETEKCFFRKYVSFTINNIKQYES